MEYNIMNNEQKQVKEWMITFGQEAPDKPTLPNHEVRLLRAKLILEEALETIDALGFDVSITVGKEEYQEGYAYIRDVDFQPIALHENSLRDIADGCADLKVVTEGTMVACGLIDYNRFQKEPNRDVLNIKDPLFAEVMRSNLTKLWSTIEVNQKVVTDGDSPAFDATAIIATNTLCDDKGNTYKAVGNDKWLVKDKDGKVIKSPSYSPPNLQPIIDSL